MKPQNEKQKQNLKLWNQVEKTPSNDWLKTVATGGRSFKAINPQKQMKQATMIFGSYGSTWGLKHYDLLIIDLEQTVKMMLLKGVFFYPEGEFQVSNTIKFVYTSSKGKYIVDDEAPKKLETNTISKALSRLGFSSDVFEGRFEEQGYEKLIQFTQDVDLSQAEIDAAKKAIVQQTEAIKLIALWNKQQRWHESPILVEFYQEELQTLQQLDN